MDVNVMNPILRAVVEIIKNYIPNGDVRVGKPFIAGTTYEGDKLLTSVGLVGQLRGLILFEFDKESAVSVVNHMMSGMMVVTELCDMTKSALGELTNQAIARSCMFLGEAGYKLDITPPTVMHGTDIELSVKDIKPIAVPILWEGTSITLHMSVTQVN